MSRNTCAIFNQPGMYTMTILIPCDAIYSTITSMTYNYHSISSCKKWYGLWVYCVYRGFQYLDGWLKLRTTHNKKGKQNGARKKRTISMICMRNHFVSDTHTHTRAANWKNFFLYRINMSVVHNEHKWYTRNNNEKTSPKIDLKAHSNTSICCILFIKHILDLNSIIHSILLIILL